MKRIHLFEWEDQSWCPSFVREAITGFLSVLYPLFKLYDPAYPKINEILQKTKINAIVDCCSGDGGALLLLRDYLEKKGNTSVSMMLTDKYPNIGFFEKLKNQYGDQIKGYAKSVDATQLPADCHGIRTFFSSFHHFVPEQAIKILQHAVDHRAPIAIFESTKRHPLDFIRALLSPLIFFFLFPFSGKVNSKKIFFTYFFPVIPFIFMWDYCISNLRTYSEKELHSLVDQVHATHYVWEIGKLTSGAKTPYLIGYPI